MSLAAIFIECVHILTDSFGFHKQVMIKNNNNNSVPLIFKDENKFKCKN